MQNNFTQVLWNYRNDKYVHSFTFYIELCMKSAGVGGNLAPRKIISTVTLIFFFFFLKDIMIVHDIKAKF